MLHMHKIDHLGIRISDLQRSEQFYSSLGYQLISDMGYENGHPVILQHPSGVMLNLLGPATDMAGENILMDVEQRYPGITHFALQIESVDEAENLMNELDIAITGRHSQAGFKAIFVRDPDRNVIELIERC